MSSKKSTTTFHSSLASLSKSAFSGTQQENLLKSFTPSSGINFGKPSNLNALNPSQDSGFSWSGLAKQAATDGVDSIFKTASGGGTLAGFGLSPIISGIAGLFGLGQPKSVPALQLFQLPHAVKQTAHIQTGSGTPSTSSAVHVHVQAMDSQSFMSRSNDIAKAVKTAMLNSHSLNDVVSEL
jgi:hypothetical protein